MSLSANSIEKSAKAKLQRHMTPVSFRQMFPARRIAIVSVAVATCAMETMQDSVTLETLLVATCAMEIMQAMHNR